MTAAPHPIPMETSEQTTARLRAQERQKHVEEIPGGRVLGTANDLAVAQQALNDLAEERRLSRLMTGRGGILEPDDLFALHKRRSELAEELSEISARIAAHEAAELEAVAQGPRP